MTTTTDVATRTPQQQLVAQVRSPQFLDQVRMALPPSITAERFVRATVTAVLQSPDIVKCDPNTVIQSVLKSAQDGLLPDGREAAIVKFGDKAAYLPMIGGLRKIAAEHGWSINTRIVYANDDFAYELGLEPRISHVPVRPGADRGDPIAAYAVARHRDGRAELEVLSKDDIEKVRRASRAANAGPWKDWWERMAEKTAGRRLFAKLPLGERDADRVRRVIEASYEPGDAAAAMYGEPPVIERAALEAGTPEAPADGDGAPESAVVDQQAGEDTASAVDSPAPGPEPELEDEPAPPADEQPAFPIPDQAIEEAGAYVVPSGGWKGRTVQQIAELGDDGEKYLRWVLSNPGRVHQDTLGSVEIYVRARLPQLLDEAAKG